MWASSKPTSPPSPLLPAAPSPTQGVAAPPGSFSRTRAACPSPSAPALWAKSYSSQGCPSSWTTAADGQGAYRPWRWGGRGGVRGHSPPSGPDLRPRPRCPPSVCENGALLCEPGGCPVPCGWSAWSSWGPCDRSCGSGVRARFRCAGRGAMELEGMGRRGASGGPRGGGGRGAWRGAVPKLPLSSGPPPTLRLLRGAPRVRARGRSFRPATRRAGQVGPRQPPSSRFLPGERGWVEPAGHSAG